MINVLMAVTAARHWTLTDGTEHPTGFWAEEFLVPYEIFTLSLIHISEPTRPY